MLKKEKSRCIRARKNEEGSIIGYTAYYCTGTTMKTLGEFKELYFAELAVDRHYFNADQRNYFTLYHPEKFKRPEIILCESCKSNFPVKEIDLEGGGSTLKFHCLECRHHPKSTSRAKWNKSAIKGTFPYRLKAILGSIRTGAKNRKVEVNIDLITMLDILMMQDFKCALTGIKLSPQTCRLDTVSIDRIDSSQNYTPENIQFVCTAANYMKGSLEMGDFIALCYKIVETFPMKEVEVLDLAKPHSIVKTRKI